MILDSYKKNLAAVDSVKQLLPAAGKWQLHCKTQMDTV
jgi:hypothetical protein